MTSMIHLEREWLFPPSLPIPVAFQEGISSPDILKQILMRRGFNDLTAAQAFLDFKRYLPASPFDLPDMEKGIDRIEQAIRSHSQIGVWGDFDVDGQTSTAILVSALRQAGARVSFHIPVRGKESHGIGIPALQDFLASGVEVLLTCDTGITAHDSIAYAQSHGINVVVTDHHLLGETLPQAYALINPRRLPPEHGLSSLPGAGVALKFVEALAANYGLSPSALHDLTALGIIADLAELRLDTRYLCQSGLALMRQHPRPSLLALLEAAEVNPNTLSEEQVSFALAPRLNAVGRLSDANPVIRFLLSERQEEIAVMVNQIEGLNAKRKILTDQVFKGALSLIEQNPSTLDHAVLILHHPEWPAGVVGIVASRLVEIFHRPVILFAGPTDQSLRGSARSIEQVDITSALRENSACLLSFGGHPMAAGMSINAENLTALQRGLDQFLSGQSGNHLTAPPLIIDQNLPLHQMTPDFVRSLESLAPFGPGNPPLVFCAENLKVISSRAVGKLGEHLLLDVEDVDGNESRIMWWNGNGMVLPETRFDLAYTPRSTSYRGEEQITFEWVDFQQSPEPKTIEIEAASPKFTHHDYRGADSPENLLREIQAKSAVQVWQEGSGNVPIKGADRFHLQPGKSLVVWSTPPNLQVLWTVLDRVHPVEIFWFFNTPAEHQPRVFLQTITNEVRNALRLEMPVIRPAELVVKTATTPALVDLALRWIASKGKIQLLNSGDEEMEIRSKGIPNPIEAAQLEEGMRLSFAEIVSFERYLQRVDLDKLTSKPG